MFHWHINGNIYTPDSLVTLLSTSLCIIPYRPIDNQLRREQSIIDMDGKGELAEQSRIFSSLFV